MPKQIPRSTPTSRTLVHLLAATGLLTVLAGCDDGADGANGEPAGPIISNISTTGSPIYPGGAVEVQVSATSPSGESLSYDWDIPEGWDGADSGDEMLVVTAPEEQAAKGRVAVTVSDGQHSREAFVVLATRGPAIESFSVDPLPEKSGDTATFTTNAYNRDGRELTYDYRVGGTLLREDRGSEWDWTSSLSMGGRYLMETIVTDIDGRTANAGEEVEMPGISEWPAFGGGRQRTAQSPAPDAEGAEGQSDWTHSAGGIVHSSPALGADGTVYVGSNDGNVYARNPDGSEAWTFSTGSAASSSPAIGPDGTIYVGTEGHSVYAINPDGNKAWEFGAGNEVRSSPAVGADGTVYVGSWNHKLYAINPDGTKKWDFLSDDQVWSSPALGADGTVYVGSDDNRVYALNPGDGSTKWAFETGDNVRSSPAVGSDGTVYVGSYDNKVYALDPADGDDKWAFETGDDVRSSPAVGSDGTIYVGSYDNKVYAINPDGSKKWSVETGGDVYSSPVLGSDGTVYVGSNDNTVYALDPANGDKKWTFDAGDNVQSSPAVGADGTIYVGSNDNNLYAIK